MAIEIGILFATTMLSFGLADFLAKKVVDNIGPVKALFFNQIMALVPIFIISMFLSKIPAISPELILLIALGAFFSIGGFIFFYKSLQKGYLSITYPIDSSWAVITVPLSIFLFGEALTSLQSMGIVITFIGIFLTSTNLNEFKKSIKLIKFNGIKEAFIAMILFGLAFTLTKPQVTLAGPLMAVLFFRLAMFAYLIPWVKISKVKITLPNRIIVLFLLGSSLLEVLGLFCYNIGITTEYVSILSAITAMAPAVTVLLAFVFLKEKVVNNQKLGIVAVLIGLLLISIV